MADMTIEDLLDAGLSLDEILLNRKPPVVNVEVNTDAIASSLDQSNKSSLQALREIKNELSQSQSANKDLLVRGLSAIFKQQNNKTSTDKPVTGLKVIRNELNLITDLKFIR